MDATGREADIFTGTTHTVIDYSPEKEKLDIYRWDESAKEIKGITLTGGEIEALIEVVKEDPKKER